METDGARVLRLVRRTGGWRVQRLSRARGRRRRSGSTAATARSRTCSSTPIPPTHRGRHHAHPSRPLRRPLRPARAEPVRPRARRPPGVRTRRRGEQLEGLVGRLGRTRSTGAWSATATASTSAASGCASRAPIIRRRRSRSRSRTTASASSTRPTPDRSGASRRSAPAPISCCRRRRTSTTTSARRSTSRPARPARWRAGAGARRLMLTHLWPATRPDRLGRRRRRRRSASRRARRAAPRDPHLIDATSDRVTATRVTTRASGRAPDELRPITFTRDYTEMAAGSVLVEFGRTRVLCTASVEERIPPWLKGKGKGWVTAEYSMLPGSTPERVEPRGGEGQAVGSHAGDPAADRPLVARGHRPDAMGEKQIIVDCDVLQADGGTRTASICGGWIALHDACSRLVQRRADARIRSAKRARRSRSASSTASRCSTSSTPRTCAPRST